MKTVQKGSEIKRVVDSEAESYIRKGFKYVSKSVWKEATRPKKETKAKEETTN